MHKKKEPIEDVADDAAREMVDAVRSETDKQEDGLTRREREIEQKRQEERRRKAYELKRQLRMRDLGMVRYRWSAAVLVLTGILSIWTEFLVVMVRPPDIGFDTYLDAFLRTNNAFFLFPLIAGGLLTVCGVLAYWNSKATFLSVIATGMMVMSGSMVYFLITFAVTVDPELVVYSTGTPLMMILLGLASLVSIILRERV